MAAVHRLYPCPSCGRVYQLSVDTGGAVRPHFANPFGSSEVCPGGVPDPKDLVRLTTHLIPDRPGTVALACCKRAPMHVSGGSGSAGVRHRFTADKDQVTCAKFKG